MKKIFIVFLITLLFLCHSICSFALSIYTWSTLDLTLEVSNDLNIQNVDDTTNPLNLECSSCILMEQHTGQILYSYNCHEKLNPASVTKLMSIYLIMEALKNRKNKL